MKRILILLSGMATLLTGCSTVKQVELGEKERWIAGAQSDLLGSYATVQTTDGRAGAGDIFKLSSDSLCMRDEGSGTVLAVELDHVSVIRQPTNAWPAVGGFVLGFLVGGLVGGAIGTDEAIHADDVESGVDAFVWTPVIGGVIGGVAGAAILGSVTSSTSYQILYTPPRKPPTQPDAAKLDTTQQRK
jgi:hypothetical protein